MYTYDALSKKIRRVEDVEFADHVIDMKKKKDVWTVIENLVSAWKKLSPEEFQAYKVHIDNTRDAQIDKKFGTTRSKDQDRRFILVFPQPLMQMIRSVYKPDELAMDKKFYREFARRFRFFQIPEKL